MPAEALGGRREEPLSFSGNGVGGEGECTLSWSAPSWGRSVGGQFLEGVPVGGLQDVSRDPSPCAVTPAAAAGLRYGSAGRKPAGHCRWRWAGTCPLLTKCLALYWFGRDQGVSGNRPDTGRVLPSRKRPRPSSASRWRAVICFGGFQRGREGARDSRAERGVASRTPPAGPRACAAPVGDLCVRGSPLGRTGRAGVGSGLLSAPSSPPPRQIAGATRHRHASSESGGGGGSSRVA